MFEDEFEDVEGEWDEKGFEVFGVGGNGERGERGGGRLELERKLGDIVGYNVG